ncbi:restriction endonuclease subunit S [Candidatus Venteria ishoeyi]|uniref:restriction endonuclease subunit S n=1 Tax=Candidatus Venteria ishoeyi TaxID=1899563 RepID=UPI0025A579EC|nr:restriction endonuclease subunit S [Candidatus Venteria ishoeyi]MDM8546743.1 restriction endonuclease subunit S [Candidatus Venteria ishoeyi]
MTHGWKIVSLGDVCVIEKTKYKDDELPYVGMEDIVGGIGKFVGSREPKKVGSSTFQFTPEHLLYGRLRPYLNKVLLPDFEGHCSSEIFPLLPKAELDKSFLFYWITSEQVVKEINHTCTGTRMPRANVKEVLKFDIPIPPIEEQKCIVAILDEAFAGIDTAIANTKKNLANARELFESYLDSIFTERPEGWGSKRFGDLTEVQSGGTPLKSKKDYWNGEIAWYSSGELNDVYTKASNNKITELGLNNSNTKLFPSGSLLIGMYDTAALKMSVLDRKAAFNQAIAGAKPNADIDLIFIMYAINAAKPEILSLRRGVRQKNLSLGKIKDIIIPIPDIAEQRNIVSEISALKEQVQRLEYIYQQKLTSLSELKQSLLQKAFSGELMTGGKTS